MAIVKKGTKYYVVIEEGRDPITKKRKQKWYSGYTDRLDAVAEEERIKTEMRQGVFIKPTKLTLAEYLDEWIESLDLRDSTLDTYKWAVEGYLKPSLGHLQLNQITADHIDRHFTAQRKQIEKDQKAAEKQKEAREKDPTSDLAKAKAIKPLSHTSVRYQFTVPMQPYIKLPGREKFLSTHVMQ